MINRNTIASSTALLLMMSAMFIYFATVTLFNTKGEPREAIVALSMLQSGNWILPESFGLDIPYKPPFMAWCIAAISWLTGGNVTELTSRLPSMISAMILVIATCRFFTRRSGDSLLGFLTAFITLTSVEVFRNATACRVDMMLTMFIVVSIYRLYDWIDSGCKGIPWITILIMSGGVLTKGPVGMILPCLCAGIWGLMRASSRLTLACKLILSGLLACVIPALWYVAAAKIGGDNFVALMLEENFGRFTGTMSYGSHENPFYYNFLTILSGMAPYTLLALLSLFAIGRLRSERSHNRLLSKISSFALTCALTILIFYCIPKSKRSVYLLPMYPMMSYFVSLLIIKLHDCRRDIITKCFTIVIGVIGALVSTVYCLLEFGVLDGIPALAKLGFSQSFSEMIVFSILAGCTFGISVLAILTPNRFEHIVKRLIMAVSFIYIFLNSAILPTLLSAKSDKYIADRINNELHSESTVYNYVATPMLRFYTTGFYTGDRVRVVDSARPVDIPAGCYLLIGEKDLEQINDNPAMNGFTYDVVMKGTAKSCDTRQIPLLLYVKTPASRQ